MTRSAAQTREATVEKWIAEYGTAVLRVCFVLLSDADQAQDAMQEMFFKAWRSMAQFEGRNGASEKTWLMRIAANVCRDMKRSRWFRHVDQRRSVEDVLRFSPAASPGDRALLMDIMALPERYRQVILLYYDQNMTIEEVAEALSLSKSTVHSRLRRAEGRLRSVLMGGECHDP